MNRLLIFLLLFVSLFVCSALVHAQSLLPDEDAISAGKSAFNLRLETSESVEQNYLAYQSYGDFLTAIGHLAKAAEIYRNGVYDPKVEPQGQVKLLVSLARLGLIDRNFLRWGTRSMVKAKEIAMQSGVDLPELLDVGFADLLMVGGNAEAASRIYRALWHAKPLMRDVWFSQPILLHGSPDSLAGVESLSLVVSATNKAEVAKITSGTGEPDKIRRQLAKAVYRPVMRAGQLTAAHLSSEGIQIEDVPSIVTPLVSEAD